MLVARPSKAYEPLEKDPKKVMMDLLSQLILRQACLVCMEKPLDTPEAFVPAYPAPYQVQLKMFKPNRKFPVHMDINEECDKLLLKKKTGKRIVSIKLGTGTLTAVLSMSLSLSFERLNAAAPGSPEQMAATKLRCMVLYHGEPDKAVTGDLLDFR